jgi:hypothetical protein
MQTLQPFIDACKSKGASDEFLAAFLTRRGWPADDVYAGLGDYWQRIAGVAIPDRRGSGENSRDAFLYLLAFSTLAIWSTALGTMLFRFIDHWLPDPVSINNFLDLRHQVTWQMASIAVAFPIYLIVMRLIFGEAMNNPERLQSGVRKWLTWIALLLTAGGLIGDLIWFLDCFLTGELTLRFILKAGVVFILCAAIFTYYLASLRWTKNTSPEAERTRSLAYGGGSALAVVIAFCIGLGVAGTPARQRLFEADRRRVEDLRHMAQAVHEQHSMPAVFRDPETNTAYDYHPKADGTYELCAHFNFPSAEAERRTFWNHNRGRSCFVLDSSSTY